jgi:hypothetical protein
MRLTDEQIGAELRALRPTPRDAFAEKLDRMAEAGFPDTRLKPDSTQGRADRSRPRSLASRAGMPVGIGGWSWGRLGPALGVLAVAGVLFVVLTNGGNGGPASGGGAGNVDLVAPQQGPSTAAPSAGAGSAGSTAGKLASPETALPPTQPVPPTGRPHNGKPQVQEQTASLGLSTDPDKLQDAADGVVQVTQRYDGFVDFSSVHAGGSRGHASFSLRIPTAHLDDAMADLSDLGHVTSSDLGTTNVTGAYADAGKAYEQARAKVNSLLEDLRNATTPSDRAAIKRQLVAAREQLTAARAALRGLKQRVALTPVSVEISASGDGSGWTIGDAADDAVSVLEAIGGALLIGLAVLVPLAALLTLGWLGARELRRRRLEAPLDRS